MKSMGVKLWAGMMALVMVVLVLLWLFQIVFLESFYTRLRISDIKNEGISIVSLLNSGNKGESENKLEAFAFNNNLNVELLDSKGGTIFTAGATGMGGQMPMMRNNARVEAFQEVLSGREVTVSLTHPRFGNKFMLIGLPVKISEGTTAVLLINLPMAPVEDTVSILKRQLLYISLILLAASLLLSFLISRSFTKPILEIKKASEAMAAGDFSVRIHSKKQDEIGKLAETINYLGQQLSKIEQLRKDLIANVSHELRTPLSLIRGYAETLRDVSGSVPEKRDKQLGIIIEETERLGRIVDDILNLSQLQAGYSNLNKRLLPVMETLETVIKRYDVLSEKSGVNIVLEGSVNAQVEADVTRLEQVLYNLINNAFNHTPKGGTISIRVVDKTAAVRIEVADTGTGIPAVEIPRIWDRYYKAEKEKDRIALGTGLGLAIVKGILEAHQAVYGVESKEGTGTTFWFELKK